MNTQVKEADLTYRLKNRESDLQLSIASFLAKVLSDEGTALNQIADVSNKKGFATRRGK